MRKLPLTLFLLFALAFASVEVNLQKNVFIVEGGQGTKTQFEITNTGSKDTFRIIPEGMPPWLFVYPSIMTLGTGSSGTVEISLSPNAPANTYVYTLKVLGSKGNEIWKNQFVFVVKEKEERENPGWIRLSCPEKVDPGETLLLNVDVDSNLLPATLDLIVLKDKSVIATFSKDLTKSSETVPLKISETDEPGTYVVRGVVRGKGIVNSTSFEINSVKKVDIEKKIESRFLGKVVKIYAKNSGNIPVKDAVSLKIPVYERFVISTEPPTAIRREGKEYRVSWEYSIKPGERTLVGSYRVDYTPYFLILALLLIALVIVFQTSKPVDIKKRFEVVQEEGSTRIKVVLNVANTSDKDIEDVVLVDRVPGICNISKFSILQPEVKETKDGYELRWDLGTLKPGEERLMSYELVLGFGIVGELTLPEPKVILAR